jgi:hypothetical protein
MMGPSLDANQAQSSSLFVFTGEYRPMAQFLRTKIKDKSVLVDAGEIEWIAPG